MLYDPSMHSRPTSKIRSGGWRHTDRRRVALSSEIRAVRARPAGEALAHASLVIHLAE